MRQTDVERIGRIWEEKTLNRHLDELDKQAEEEEQQEREREEEAGERDKE